MNGEKRARAQKLIETALEQLAQALAAERSEALTAYLKAFSRFHRYSFQNIMLIVSQRPDATYVAGFNTWKKLNRCVRKGEKGIIIFAPIRPRYEDQGDDETLQGEEERAGVRFKAAYVFDISQTEGEPLPEFSRVTGSPRDYTARLKALIAADGIRLEYTEDMPGLGQSWNGVILLRPDLSPAAEFAVLIVRDNQPAARRMGDGSPFGLYHRDVREPYRSPGHHAHGRPKTPSRICYPIYCTSPTSMAWTPEPSPLRPRAITRLKSRRGPDLRRHQSWCGT
jgi:hypothetical protein